MISFRIDLIRFGGTLHMIRLVSLNIERSRHLDRFIPFLRRFQPDVVCLQELVESDIPAIQAGTDLAHVHFVAMSRFPDNPASPFGVGILSRTPFVETDFIVYSGNGDGHTLFDRTTEETRIETGRFAVARASVELNGETLSVGTTHFPWTPDGEPREFQHNALTSLTEQLDDSPLVLTGDFNAPRGGPIFDVLAARWRDCIPQHVTSSLDPAIHRVGHLQLMVDGLFSTPHYDITEVALHTGLSDHQAVSATITKAASAR